jgi:hypothetical protein
MASLTSSQIEILRRLTAGQSLYSCSDIPHLLNEVICLSRIHLLAIDESGSPSVTELGSNYLSTVEDDSSFIPLEPNLTELSGQGTRTLPQSLRRQFHSAGTPDGPLSLSSNT